MKLTQDFLETVKDHKMTVLLENGVYRHLRFRNPATINRYFEIVTFPGRLVIVGDMGSYVFERLNDMFEFFRGDTVNLCYWGEKVQAVCKHSLVSAYKPEIAEKRILEVVDEYYAEEDDPEALTEKKRILEEVEDLHFEDRSLFMAGVQDIDAVCLQDFWENDLEEYSYQYTWCCQAIVWAIQQLDARPENQGESK